MVSMKKFNINFKLYYRKWRFIMKKYICIACGYIYDPEVGDPDNGVAPGTSFEALADDWVCPLCGVGKEDFEVTE